MTNRHRAAAQRAIGLAEFPGPPVQSPFGLIYAGIAAVAAATSVEAYYGVMTGLTRWDDEGYLLLSLKQYASGGVLFNDVYSQYGPAYYQLLSGVFAVFRLPFDHTHGRLFVLALWVVSAALCALAVGRWTRNIPVTLCAQVLTFHGLASLKTEPLHPGGILCLLLSALILAGTFLRYESASLSAVFVGALLGAGVLTKVNVGGLALVSVSFALLAPANGRWRRLTAAAFLAFVLAPTLLLAGSRDAPWAPAFVSVVTCSAVGVGSWLLFGGRRIPGSPLAAITVLLSFAMVVVVSCGLEFLRGTTLQALWHGIVLDRIRQPEVFTLPLNLPPMAVRFSLVSMLLAILVVLLKSRRPADAAATAARRGGLLILVGITILAVGVTWRAQMHYVASLPLLWLVLALPGPERDGVPDVGRSLLLAVATLQPLHAYPVASSQIYFSTFLLIPAGAIAVSDGWRILWRSAGFLVAPGARGRALGGIACFAILMAPVVWWALEQPWRTFTSAHDAGVPLGLRGTERIRVPAPTRAMLQELVGRLSRECRTFLTLPGMNSLYLFSNIEPPSTMNATAWMLLLSDSQQAMIRRRISGMPDPVCAVRDQPLVEFWARGRDLSREPLVKYLDEAFVKEAQFGRLELLVRKSGVPGGEHRRDEGWGSQPAPRRIPGGS